ncbi:MAG TPA: hypothetical protein VGL71_09065 [Urbifossiella sp.]
MGKKCLTWGSVALWLVCCAIGFGIWHKIDVTPGSAATSPVTNQLPAAGNPRVVLYLHPRCPCSRASLEEFAGLLEKLPAGVDAEIVFIRPPGVAEGWEQGQLWNDAATLPRVRLRVDVDGIEAERVGATTSGFAVYTDASGRIRFQGGITRGRGLLGDNPGRRTLEAEIHGGTDSNAQSPVFGCPLFDPNYCPKAGGRT